MQLSLPVEKIQPKESHKINSRRGVKPFKAQLLKWIGNKQRFAHEIISFFPEKFGTYHEPFLGSGAVLGVLAPKKAIVSDIFKPLIGIWKILKEDPDTLKEWYHKRWHEMHSGDRIVGYESIKARYNKEANPADLLFLSRSCYGGVIRFRQRDGYMSTPCGIHKPIAPESFSDRVDKWAQRVNNTEFLHCDYVEALARAKEGDVVYCDPPYSNSQTILYGAQTFRLSNLFECIKNAKDRGVFVALSIDGSKKSGKHICPIDVPVGLFDRELSVNVGRSMLRRFQMDGKSLEAENVTDRLLLTH